MGFTLSNMKKEQIIEIAEAMGFQLNYDKGEWLRFQLKDELDEQSLRWIWFFDQDLSSNMARGAEILFKAGQKAFKLRQDEFIDLY